MIAVSWRWLSVMLIAWFAFVGPARSQPASVTIAAHVSLTGPSAFGGRALLRAVRFAVDEANANDAWPRINLAVFDDKSTVQGALAVAHEAAASDSLAVVGPAVSPLALAACPDYATAGVPVIDATVHADAVTDNATTFRIVVSTGEIGEAQATYLARILHQTRAIVLYRDNGYGRPLAARFQIAGTALDLAATEQGFSTPAQRDAAVKLALADPEQPALVLGMTYEDAVPVLIALRRGGYRGPIIGTATMARASFADLFAKEPEEHARRGFFTDGVYAVAPMILDSANAETLDFAARYRARYGSDPSWETVQGYDGARLAIRAARAAAMTSGSVAERRAAVLRWLAALRDPGHAMRGLTGPIWFTPERIRAQAVRIGRFHDGLFESAPLQLVPVTQPDPAELSSGAVFATGPGRFARVQQVVATGVYINEVSDINMAKSTFGADFWLWERFAPVAAENAADPANLVFDNLVSGKFDRARPAEARTLSDGTQYRLWRMRGVFRADYDLHRFPFDSQRLTVPFFHAGAASDRVIYVLDRRAAAERSGPVSTPRAVGGALAATPTPAPVAEIAPPIIAARAFHDLTQWESLGVEERRDNLVSQSALGDPTSGGAASPRELSGFRVTIDVRRRALAALSKMLTPLFLMTLIMFASLYFPTALVKEKITVGITGALSGAVLLAAVNRQLGDIGYTLAVEYAFYVFFGLSLLCVVAVLLAERFRVAKHAGAALITERSARLLFLFGVGVIVAGGVALGFGGG